MPLMFPGVVALLYHLNQFNGSVLPTFYSDYFYPYRGSTCYAIRGGTSTSGSNCGAFSVLVYNDASYVSCYRSAALSFKPIV